MFFFVGGLVEMVTLLRRVGAFVFRVFESESNLEVVRHRSRGVGNHAVVDLIHAKASAVMRTVDVV